MEEIRQCQTQPLPGAIEPAFHPAFRAMDDAGDFPAGEVLVMMQQQGGLQVMR